MEIIVRVIDGRLSVQTNITDKAYAVGMLELAKMNIVSQPAAPPIQVPSPAMSKLLVNGAHNGHG